MNGEDNQDARDVTYTILKKLEEKHGRGYFASRLDDVIVFDAVAGDDDDDVVEAEPRYIYQIGVIDGDTTTWIIDVHAETLGDDDEALVVGGDGVKYSNLKDLIERTSAFIESTKAMKRGVRTKLLKEALLNISKFNKTLFKQICAECKRGGKNGRESFTGFKLSCVSLEKFCNAESDKKAAMEDELAKRRAARLRELEMEDL